MQWGVVPHWQRFGDESGQIKTINARGENLLEAPTGLWASLKKNKRCVVVVHGYFEWLKPQPPTPANGEKKPHFIRYKDDSKLMMFAGLWDCVKLEDAPNGQELYTFAIVTVETSKQLEWLHDRMPLILTNDNDIDTWLDNDKGWSKEVASIVKPYTGPDLEWYGCLFVSRSSHPHASLSYPVPTEVGKVGTDSPSYVLPVSQRKDGIQAMFARQKAKPAVSSSASLSSPSSSRLTSTSTQQTTPLPSTPTTPRASRQQKTAAAPDSNEVDRDVIEICSSPPPKDPNVIDITSSPMVTTPGKRKRPLSPPPSTRKKPKMGAASPIKQKVCLPSDMTRLLMLTFPQQQKQAAKGTAKITSFFSSKE